MLRVMWHPSVATTYLFAAQDLVEVDLSLSSCSYSEVVGFSSTRRPRTLKRLATVQSLMLRAAIRMVVSLWTHSLAPRSRSFKFPAVIKRGLLAACSFPCAGKSGAYEQQGGGASVGPRRRGAL
jgi:hypothetical protein